MSYKSPARRAFSQFRRVLRAVGLLEGAAAPSVRNAGKRVRARQALAAESERLITA
jgi:hypothetical protein